MGCKLVVVGQFMLTLILLSVTGVFQLMQQSVRQKQMDSPLLGVVVSSVGGHDNG